VVQDPKQLGAAPSWASSSSMPSDVDASDPDRCRPGPLGDEDEGAVVMVVARRCTPLPAGGRGCHVCIMCATRPAAVGCSYSAVAVSAALPSGAAAAGQGTTPISLRNLTSSPSRF